MSACDDQPRPVPSQPINVLEFQRDAKAAHDLLGSTLQQLADADIAGFLQRLSEDGALLTMQRLPVAERVTSNASQGVQTALDNADTFDISQTLLESETGNDSWSGSDNGDFHIPTSPTGTGVHQIQRQVNDNNKSTIRPNKVAEISEDAISSEISNYAQIPDITEPTRFPQSSTRFPQSSSNFTESSSSIIQNPAAFFSQSNDFDCFSVNGIMSDCGLQTLSEFPEASKTVHDKTHYRKAVSECTLPGFSNVEQILFEPKNIVKNYIAPKMEKKNVPMIPVLKDEIILTISFNTTCYAKHKVAEFLILGSQKLTALRDAFYCLSDFQIFNTHDENPNTRTRKITSSYFFIEDVFYNDMRWAFAIDYSQSIIDWVREEKRYTQNGLAMYTSKVMDDTRFVDLTLRLNYPYIFTHQGNCSHNIIVQSMRRVYPSDEQNQNVYPIQTYQGRSSLQKCSLCQLLKADWITIDDIHAPQNPCYWCESCFDSFHFLEDGTPSYDHTFQKYPYVFSE